MDRNAATHLIRNALGGTDYGIEHSEIARMLSLPQDKVRLFRDDLTVTVIYFDQEYLRNCPA
jgi:pyruvate dehydrogenase phosphatase